MKKITLLAGLLLVVHTMSLAQIYIRANVGYNLPLSPELVGMETTYTETPDVGYVQEFTGVYGSYGSGFSAGVAIGGSFKNSVLGYDLAFRYLAGKKYTLNSWSDYEIETSHDVTYQSTAFQFMPSLTLAVGTGKFQPFTRFGPVISVAKVNEEIGDYNSYYDQKVYMKYEYSGGIAIGLHGSVGVTYGISEQLKVIMELNMISMSYAPHKRTITDYTFNGQDSLDSIDEEEREIDLDKSYKTENQEMYPVIRKPFSMNSWGLQVGVAFSFGQ